MLNNNLKYCREELEMTQEELGFVFGVSRQTVTGWETNQDPMPLSKLVKFSNLYKYSIDYVIGLRRKNDNYIEIKKLNKKQVGSNLKAIRNKLGLTQQQIADECMITQPTYSGYESGRFLVTSLTLYTICLKHNLSIYDILK
ncbi:MAG: transcriptional regulator [Bacilli bacterium]|jgi:transcriptional regulator with XRE-family HTH domain|nr:transcriptional regulator [Bacilli bacterium]NMA50574.1 transcriptional regulator [Mollicutes bacterium]